MKKAVTLFFVISTFAVKAQQADSTLFDFWVGHWDLHWTNASGKIEKGENRIERILDGKVIQENFCDETGGFKGTSISVYNPQQKKWHQAWADNQGGYYDLEGSAIGAKRIFSTHEQKINGKIVTQRMVFYDIKPDSLTWDWELTRDGGKTWELQWRIYYVRKS